MIFSNNRSQMVSAANKLREMVKDLDVDQIQKLCGEEN